MIVHEQNVVPRSRRARVAKPQRSSLHILAVVVLFLVLSTQVYLRILIVREGYRIEELRSQALKSDASYRDLKLKHAASTSPMLLLKRSRNQLGMKNTTPNKVRRLRMIEDV